MKFEGFGDLARTLGALSDPKQAGKVMAGGVREAMKDVKQRAAQLIPTGVEAHQVYSGRVVAPGFAKRNILLRVKRRDSEHRVIGRLGVALEAYYAVQYVELGTSKMAAQPWLRPAFLSSKDPTIRSIGEEVNNWIKGLAEHHTASGNIARGAQLLANAEQFDGPGE